MNEYRAGVLPNAPQPRLVAGASSQRLLPSEYRYDFVGPLPVLGDVIARDFNIGEELKIGSLVAIADCGAYCESLAATSYCSRPRPAEVLVSAKHSHLIREREEPTDQLRREKNAPSNLVLPGANGETVEEGNEDTVSEHATTVE